MDAAGGISFAIVGKHRSAIFQQLDGSIELAVVLTLAGFLIYSAMRSLGRFRSPLEEDRIRIHQEPRRKYKDRMTQWCHDFNVRNRWIVPEKSPESIFRAAQRRRRA